MAAPWPDEPQQWLFKSGNGTRRFHLAAEVAAVHASLRLVPSSAGQGGDPSWHWARSICCTSTTAAALPSDGTVVDLASFFKRAKRGVLQRLQLHLQPGQL